MTFYILGVELLVSLAIGIISSFFVSSKEIAFLIGIGAFFCVEMVRIRVSTANNQEKTQKILSVLESLAPADTFSELVLLYGMRSASQLVRGTVRVHRDQIWDFWKDCVSKTNNRWSVLTYTRARDTWDLGWGETTALAIQKERIENGCQIERVFVVDTKEELDHLRPTMEQHCQIGIHVSYLYAKELLKNPHCRDAYDYLDTLDVGISDGLWVYKTHLDKRRSMLGASATRDQAILRKTEFLLREAQKMSIEFTGN